MRWSPIWLNAEKEMNWPFLGGQLRFDEPLFKQFDVGGIPFSVVADRKGIVRWFGGSAYFLRDRLRRILSPLDAAGSP